MPATAGRTRMPHNNRMSTSGALKMTGIWSDAIGYDPYAAEGEAERKRADAEEAAAAAQRRQGILELARLSSVRQGAAERGTNFAQDIFWGLKRKGKPPKGYELPQIDDDDESDEESDGGALPPPPPPPRETERAERKRAKKERKRKRRRRDEDDDERRKDKKKSKKDKKRRKGEDANGQL